jgi:predicted nuclease of predicted toxin-antitoxin system
VKLLYDHNLSPRLVTRLADCFPTAEHVAGVGLAEATDAEVWAYAAAHDYTIVTKDADFTDMSVLRGFPPKVIWLRVGNCTTATLEALLRHHAAAIHAFLADPAVGTLLVR